MTVIAYRNGVLAADKQRTIGNLKIEAKKIEKIGDYYLGCAGDVTMILKFKDWFKKTKGKATAKNPYPVQQTDEDVLIGELHAPCVNAKTGNAEIWVDSCELPMPVDSEFIAIGSGTEFAMAAMVMGASAVEAIEIAAKLCPSCGLGVDSVEIKPTGDKKSPSGE